MSNFATPLRARYRGQAYTQVNFDSPLEVVSFLADLIMDDHRDYGAIANEVGVCLGTIRNLAEIKTSDPRHKTTIAVLKIYGFKLAIRKG